MLDWPEQMRARPRKAIGRDQRLEPATTRRQRPARSGAEKTRSGTRDEMMSEHGLTSREGQSQNRQNRQAEGRLRDAQQMRAADRAAVITTKHVGQCGAGQRGHDRARVTR